MHFRSNYGLTSLLLVCLLAQITYPGSPAPGDLDPLHPEGRNDSIYCQLCPEGTWSDRIGMTTPGKCVSRDPPAHK